MPSDSVLILQQPPVPPPESALIAGMAAPQPPAIGPQVGPGEQGMVDTSLPGNQQLQEPGSWSYDFNTSGVARATFNGEVVFTSGGSATAGVTTWNGRTGAVVLTSADVTAAGGAPLASPPFTGTPAAPKAAPGTSPTQIATTAFVNQAITATPLVASFNGRTGAVTLSTSDITTAGGAPADSPSFTGTPTTTTALAGNASGRIASTQFVMNAIGAAVVSWNGRGGAVTLNLSDVQSVGGAPVASPGFTGIPSAPTASPGTATTQLATTAYVMNAVTAAASGVSTWNTRSGAVTLQAADLSGVGGALLAGPAFTGNPTAPTQTAGDNSTRIATTAFVATAISGMAPVVASFNARTGAVTLQAADVTGVGGALLASPVFTGTPAAPTPTAGDSSTRIATTAFVAASFANLASPVFTGDPRAPTPATADNDTSIATTAYVQNVVAGYVKDTGDTMTGALFLNYANPSVVLNKTGSGQTASVQGQTNGLTRWVVTLGDSAPESGAQAGSNYVIASYNDAGALVAAALQITRSNNQTTLGALGCPVGTPVGGFNNVNSLNYAPGTGLKVETNTGIPALQLNRNGGNGPIVEFYQGAGTLVGTITVANGASTAYNTSSDARLKTDLQPCAAGPILDALAVYDFRWKGSQIRGCGVLAQEAAPIFPDAITHDTERDTWGADYSKYVPLLLAEIKSLRARVAALEA